jgi:hypothetical protein
MKNVGKSDERFVDCIREGRRAAKHLPTFATEDAVMKRFGFKNRQEAHWQCLRALGKLIIRCRKSMHEEEYKV